MAMALRSGLRLVTHKGRSLGHLKWARRQFSKEPADPMVNVPSQEIVTPLPPLSQAMPGLPKLIYASSGFENSGTQVTTLENGLRVASEPRFGQFCTVGVVVDSGSRYETDYPNGVSHFLEKLAFNSTQHYKNRDSLLMELEQYGGICDCQSSRDAFLYATSIDRRGLETAVKVLGEAVLRPNLSAEEIDFARQTVEFELETLFMRPEQETILIDMIHAAAYRKNTLGLPKICPEENMLKIDRDNILTFLASHYVPKRMVVAGVGVEHDALVEYVQKHFIDIPSIWSSIGDRAKLPDASVARYTGGIIQDECDVPLYPGSDLPELSHVVIGLEGCSHQDDDFIAMCVLNMMMGGGGSFSAGGPGKGMYTRLYTNVLNRYYWMYNATAYNHAYGDTGLFCIHASAPPVRIGETVEIILREMLAMAGNCHVEELNRAKRQLQSMLLMNLEGRPVVFEDIARQVLATGLRRSPKFFIDAIEQISVEDIKRISQRLLSSPPSVAARGRLKTMQSLEQVQKFLASPPSNSSRLKLFR